MKITKKYIEESIKELDAKLAIEKLVFYQEEHGISLDKLIEKYERKLLRAEKERERYESMCLYERDAQKKGYNFIAGIDEAGRGPLAGPVVAAAVVLPEDIYIDKLNDSKKLTAQKREELFQIIKEKAIAYGVGIVDEKYIDEMNILNATKRAMMMAINSLDIRPDILFIDAVNLENGSIEEISIEKGDMLSVSIAAASIVAKVTRDRIIDSLDTLYPQYGFIRNKGYGTAEHINAIKKYGICPIHRVSFTRKFVD